MNNGIIKTSTFIIIILDFVGSMICLFDNDYLGAIYDLLLIIILLLANVIVAVAKKGDK